MKPKSLAVFALMVGMLACGGGSVPPPLTVPAPVAQASVTVSPSGLTVNPGQTQRFTATVTGLPSAGVTWSVNGVSGENATLGTIDSNGIFATPYPAPPWVTVTATSMSDPSQSGSVNVTLAAPAGAAGPALSVDAGAQTHAISPLIYGTNGLNPTLVAEIRPTVDR